MGNLYSNLISYYYQFKRKYENEIENKWFWCFFALLIVVSHFAYAFYCTRRGYSFAGRIKFRWPKIWEMGIGCKRR